MRLPRRLRPPRRPIFLDLMAGFVAAMSGVLGAVNLAAGHTAVGLFFAIWGAILATAVAVSL